MTSLLAVFLLAVPTAQPTAEQVARALPHVQRARGVLEREIGRIADPALRKAVQEQLAWPGLPASAYARRDPQRTEALLRDLGLLAAAVSLPALNDVGSFWAAPGGVCPDGHHAYPGGLAVHSAANLLHAAGLARAYRELYGVDLRGDWLVAAAAWHDSAKAMTLRWQDGGDCGREPEVAKTAAHHVLGVAAAIARGLPAPLIVAIASAHAAPTRQNLERLCGWLRAGSVLATGAPDAVACPDEQRPPPIESYLVHYSDTDYELTAAASSAALGGGTGWKRFDPLRDSTELQLLQRRASRAVEEPR